MILIKSIFNFNILKLNKYNNLNNYYSKLFYNLVNNKIYIINNNINYIIPLLNNFNKVKIYILLINNSKFLKFSYKLYIIN